MHCSTFCLTLCFLLPLLKTFTLAQNTTVHVPTTLSLPFFNSTSVTSTSSSSTQTSQHKSRYPEPHISQKHAWTAPITHPPIGIPSATRPTYTPEPQSQSEPHRHRRANAPVLITFGVLGCLAVAIFAISMFRCCYSYNKTPQPDRIAVLLNRYRLQTEMEEIARRAGRRPSTQGPPPPPYCPKPPEYDSVAYGTNV